MGYKILYSIVGMLLLRKTNKPMDIQEVTKSDSIPMTTRDTARYTVGQQHRSTSSTPATSRLSTATTSYPAKAATSYPTKAPSSYPTSSTLPAVPTTDTRPPLPQPRCPANDETEPMYEVTDVGGGSYMDMA